MRRWLYVLGVGVALSCAACDGTVGITGDPVPDTGATGDTSVSQDADEDSLEADVTSDTGASDVDEADTGVADTGLGLGDTGAADTGGSDTASADTGAQDTGAAEDVAEDAPGPILVPVVYAHGPDVLYSLNPDTQVIREIGRFSGCSSVIDMAVDKEQNIFVTTSSGLYTVNPATAACTLVSSGSYPNSLSFIPEGTLLPDEEALVGYRGSQYIQIDRVTGAITPVGTGLTGGYGSSGDIVSVVGGGTYLTVYGNGCGDCIVEVNPVTGDLIRNWGTVRHGAVYGLAYWGGTAYGFTNGGEFFTIDFDEASGATITSELTFPDRPDTLRFWGAGSTTIAPVFN